MVETYCFYGLHSFQLLPFASTCRSRAIRLPKGQISAFVEVRDERQDNRRPLRANCRR